MVKAILIVAALVLCLLYTALFLKWNADTSVNLITWDLGGGNPWWFGDVAVGLLPIIGMALGALIMAVAAWVPWSTQRRTAKTATAKLNLAIEKFNQQKELLKKRNSTIEELQVQVEELELALEESQEAAEVPPEAEQEEDWAEVADEFQWDEKDEAEEDASGV